MQRERRETRRCAALRRGCLTSALLLLACSGVACVLARPFVTAVVVPVVSVRPPVVVSKVKASAKGCASAASKAAPPLSGVACPKLDTIRIRDTTKCSRHLH